jgi:glycine/D-amino acid oxidase-like deaminating enzyme
MDVLNGGMHDVAAIRSKFEVLRPFLDERRRRLWAAAEALVLGRGGITAVATATGLQRATVRVGMRELRTGPATSATGSAAAQEQPRVRAPGGGRKPLTMH